MTLKDSTYRIKLLVSEQELRSHSGMLHMSDLELEAALLKLLRNTRQVQLERADNMNVFRLKITSQP